MTLFGRPDRLLAFLIGIRILTGAAGADGGTALRPIRQHPNVGKRIALTFDDGPHRQYTAKILDILEEFGVSATFFVIGENAEKNPGLIRRILCSGHEIGNHTFSHPDLIGISKENLKAELEKTEKVLWDLERYCPRLFRPPGGVYSDEIASAADQLGYCSILWTVDTKDWKGLPTETIANTILHSVKPGAIILCHDYVFGESHTPDALRIALPKLLDEGYRFVTVTELLTDG